jgi:hypothetical protein
MGREVPRRMVPPGDAFPNRADEEDRPLNACAPRLILNYFRAQKLLSSGVVEGLNKKAKVTMRRSYGSRTLPNTRTRALSLTWQAAGTRFHPRFLLTSLVSDRAAARAAMDLVPDGRFLPPHPGSAPDLRSSQLSILRDDRPRVRAAVFTPAPDARRGWRQRVRQHLF